MSSEDKTLEPSDHGPSPAPGSTAATPVGSPANTDKRPRGRPRKDGIAVPQKTRKKCRSRGKAALDDEDSMDSVGPAEADPVLEPAGKSDTQAQPVDRMPIPCAERTEEEPVPPLPLEPAGGEMGSSEPLCAFCYCGERSLLGQGELKRFGPTPGYAEGTRPRRGTAPQKEEDGGGSLGCRAKEQSNTVPSTETPFDEQTGLFLEEFGQVGLPDDIDLSHLFEPSGHCWAHQSCAVWSHGVCQQQDLLRNVDRAVDSGSTKHCTYCKRLGATIRCCEELCHRWYHYPCAAAAGTFQDIQSHCLLCPEHIEQAVEKAHEGANCAVCDSAGDLLDQLFCTSCGQHYHGLCLDIAVTPLKRAGWQCPDCKICQTCRNPGEDSKMLVCDTCDKGYHTFCLQPVMESIPTNGWRCKKCRVCEQCGTRSSPQWHHNSLLCDNCYQQTDDSLACLLCRRPVHVALQKDMMCCQMCKRWIHLECEKPAEDETLERAREHYVCPHCKVAPLEGSSELQVAARVDQKESESASEAIKETTREATSSEEVKAQSPGGLAASPTDVAQDEAAIPERTSHAALLSAELCDPKGQGQESDNLAEAPSRQSLQQQEEDEEEEASGLPEEGLAEGSGAADAAGPLPMDLCPPTELKPPDAAVVEGGAEEEEEDEEEEEEDEEDEEDEDDEEVSEMDSTPASERSFSELSSPAEKPSPNSKLVAPPATLGPIVPPPFIPVPPKIGMGKPAITKRKFSPGRPRIRQGAWNTHNLVSSPLWAPERCEGWDTPRSRQPSASNMWSIKVGRGSGFPGKRRPRGANLSGRGGRGRAKLKNGIGAILAPGVGLLDLSSVKDEEENSMHNTVVLFSNSDRFTLKQDMCVVCGSFGRGVEGRLLACSQCGQCYHPYCVSIKITKVVLSKGWRCLECTVCEACGKATDPGRLLLCDDCDISYHTYCLEPPLQTVPKGGWKCKWCVCCTHCGATTPGPRCEWQNNYTQCAPCASLATCPVCCRNYREDELIVQCQQCNRWIHACCENLNSEEELEAVADVSFDCTMCRNFSVQAHGPIQEMMESSLTAQMVAKLKEQQELSRTYTQDGVCLTESGLTQLQSLTAAMPRRKRPKPKLKLKIINQNSVAVLQTPPELQSEHSRDGDVDDTREGELVDCDGKSESSPDREPADDDAKGTEDVDGVKKRKRKPYRPGIGGFMVRQRSRTGQGKAKRPLFRKDSSGSVSEQLVGKEEAWTETLPNMPGDELLPGSECLEKTKKRYRKKKNKLEETFPAYLQEAFFGKDLLDTSRQIRLSLDALSDEDPTHMDKKMAGVNPNFLDPSSDPLLSSATTSVSARPVSQVNSEEPLVDLSEVLTTDDDLLGILSDELCKPSADSAALDMGSVPEEPQPTAQQSAQRAVRPLTDEPLDGILSPELDKMVTDGAILSKLYKIPELEGKDVEELFTAVLSPTASLHAQPPPSTPLAPPLPLHGQGDALFPRAPDMNGLIPHFPVAPINPPGACIPNNFAHMHRLPYPDSGRDKKPPFNQLVSEPMSTWTTPAVADGETDNMSNAQRSTLKWEKEETLGDMATVAPVLYTNINYPNLKEEFPEWSTRVKQIAKLWRKASSQDRAPYVQKARDNRAALRINKVQLSNDSLKRQHQHQELIDPGMHLDSELLIKDPQKHKESEHEQEWKFRQQMRQKSKQQAKIEATQKLEQVKSEQQQQLQQQQQQQQLPTVGSETPSGGHQSPLTPQPNNGSLSPAKDGFAHPQLCTTPTPAPPPDDVFLRPQAPPPTPTRVPAQDSFSRPPSPHMFSPGNSSSSRPASPWDPYAKMVGTPRPPAAGPAPPRRSSVDCCTPPSAAERGRPSPAHDSFGSPTPLGGDMYAKPPDTPRPAGAPMRGGIGVEIAGDASSRKSMYNRMPQPRMILSDPYSRPLLASMPGSNESGSDALFKAPRPPLVSQDPLGPRSDLCGPRPSVGEQFPQAPRVLRQPPGEPFSQPRAAHDPYARPPGTPRPISDLYSQSPSASRPSSFDPYAQMPPTSRAPSMLAADPYLQPPGTPRPVQNDPYSQPPGTPRPVQNDPYSQPPGTPRPVQNDPYSQPPGTPRPVHSDPYSQPPGTPRPVHSDPYSQPPGTPRPVQNDPYSHPPRTPRPVHSDPYSQLPGTPQPHPPQRPVLGDRFSESSAGARSLDPYSQPPGTPRPVAGEPYSQPPRAPRSLPSDPYAQPPGTPRPGACEAFARPAATRPGLVPNHDSFLAAAQSRGVGSQDGFPLAPDACPPALKVPGKCDEPFSNHDPYEQQPMTPRPPPPGRLPTDAELPAASQEGSFVAPSAQKMPQTSSETPPAENEERLRQRLRELILRQQQHKIAVRQEKGLPDAAMPLAPGTPHHWPQDDSSCQEDLFSRPPPPYPGTMRGPPRFPGSFAGDQNGSFPAEGHFGRPPYPGDVRPHGARFGYPPGPMAGQERFLGPPLPVPGQMLGLPQQLRRSVSMDASRHTLPKHFPPQAIQMAQHNIMGQPFIELRHRPPESRFRLPFGPPVMEPPPRGGCAPEQQVGFPGNAAIAGQMPPAASQVPPVRSASNPAGGERLRVPIHPGEDLPVAARHVVPEEKLEADDSAVKDLEDVEVKDLDDADLETLNLEDGKGDDLDLEANDLHLDDLLQSGKFDIIAYTDPELNSEDKKDMFNEELELSDHTEERTESAGEGPGGPSDVKSECVEELCSEVAPTDDGAGLVAADCRDGSAEPSEDLPDLLTKEPEDGTAGDAALGPLTSPPVQVADTPASRGTTEQVAGHEVQPQFVSAHVFVEPGLTGQPPAAFPPPPSKERPLLLDEQPLLLQDLLDQERQEQQQQRQMQAMIRQRSSDSFFPNIDFDAITDPIMKAKMVALNGINKVMVQTNMVMPSMINRFPFVGQQPGGHGGDRAVIPPQAVGPDGKLAPQMARPNPPSFGPGFVDDAQKHKYEEWLQDTQQLLQMQQKFLEEQIGAHRKSKKALSAKQRTARKAGREFPEEDAEQLKHVTEQQSLVQKQLEQIRKQQKEHGELIEEYRIKQQQHCGMTPSMMGPPGAVDQQAAFPFQPQQHAPPPRMPGWPPVRMQSQMPQPVPATGALPVPANGAPHVKFDDNNPFSEGFQERERKERLREQQERQRVQLMQEVERQRVLQQQLELGGPQMTNRASLSHVPFFTSELPQDFLQPQRPPPVGQVFPPQHGFIGAPRFMQVGERRPFAQEAHPTGPTFHPMSHALQCPPRPPAFGPAAEPATLLPPNYPGSGQSLIQLYSNIIPEEKGKKKKKRSRKKKKEEEEEDDDAESVQTPSTPHSDPASTPTRTLLPHGQGEREPQPATTGQPPSELERQLSSSGAPTSLPLPGARQAAVTLETDEPSKVLRRVKLEKVECQVSEEPMDEPPVGPVKMEEAKDGGSSLEKPGLALGAAAAAGAKVESGNELLKHLLKSKSLGQHQRSEESGHSGDGAVQAGEEAIAGTFGVDAPRPPPTEQDKKKPRSKRVPRTGDKCVSRSKKRKKDEEERQALCPSTDALMSQLKQQLSLLPLMEPIISVNLAHFSPYGSGRLNGESRLTGTFGSASLDGVSDYYSQLIYKQNNLSNPPTPPASLPPTPPPGVRQKLVNGFASTEELDSKVTVMSGRDVSRCLGAKPLQMPFRPDEDLLARAMAHGPKMVDVPASLPTPPHNNQEELRCHEEKDCEEPDPVDSFVPSSSPESVVGMEVSRYPDLSLVKEEPPDPAASPVIPMLPSSCGKGSEVRNCAVKMEPLYGSPFTSTQSSSRDSLVSIAITLNSAAAENISGVVAAVADFLRVSIPNSYEVSCAPERADGPALGSLKMQQQHHQAYGARAPCAAGPNKFASRACGFHVPGSLLNTRHSVRGHGGPKPQWCCHCKVVVLGNGVRKAIRDLPGKREENSEGSLVFCSHNCMVLFSRGSPDLKDATQVSPVCSFREPLGKAPHPYSNHTSALDVHCLPQLQTKESPPPTPPIAFPPAASEAKADELKVTVKLKPRPRTVPPGPDEARPLGKKWKGARWRKWSVQVVIPKGHFKLPGESDVDELLKRLCTPLRPEPLPRDHRKCCFCHEEGDGTTDGPARLLNLDLDVWVHLNCALWSTEVYETQAGALMNVELALRRGLAVKCVFCHKTGATGGCHRLRCTNIYHFTCALKAQCMFFKDKTMLCHMHKPRGLHEQELRYFAVFRRVYVQRDEVRQIASIVQRGERDHTFRVGSLIFHSVGQLLPQQLRAFHSACAIFPVGYEASRIYWSTRHSNRRCRYLCSIDEKEGLPEFSLRVVEQGYEDLLLTDTTPKGVWDQVLQRVAELRSQVGTLKLFPVYLKGEDLFGLSVSVVTRIIESLPGVEACDKYTFRYGRNPLMELPLAINPTGCARSESRAPSHVKRFVLRPHTLNSSGTSKSFQSTVTGELNAPYSKQFVHSKSSQYRKMKAEWKSNVYLARSRIQGLGLYAARDIEKHTMVIEYIGTVIRNEVANRKEKLYESQNRGVYMFRIDNAHVIDATLTGGPARYINHSCAPNCVAEGVTFEKGQKIIISSNRRIQKGEELCYDYKFDFEDDQHKIPCHCGAVNCRKWMN